MSEYHPGYMQIALCCNQKASLLEEKQRLASLLGCAGINSYNYYQ